MLAPSIIPNKKLINKTAKQVAPNATYKTNV